MLIGEMESSALFHVIDAKTTYKLGRPWLHEYGVVPSMYHQCFKYFQDGQVKKIVADHKPFTIAESHFAHTKFYLEDDMLEEAQVIVSPSSKEVNLHSKTSRIDSPIEEKETKPIKEKETKQTKTSTKEKKHQASKATKAVHALHYVPITKRKEGQSPCPGDRESVLEDLQGLTLLVAKITKPWISSQPLKGFTRPFQGSIVKHGTLPTKQTKEGFDPNAYRLMAKAGYDHEKMSGLGKLILEASRKEEHEVLKGVKSSKAGIGYILLTPVHIPIWKASVSVISTNYEEEEQSSNLWEKSFVFYHIGWPTTHILVFDRLGT